MLLLILNTSVIFTLYKNWIKHQSINQSINQQSCINKKKPRTSVIVYYTVQGDDRNTLHLNPQLLHQKMLMRNQKIIIYGLNMVMSIWK